MESSPESVHWATYAWRLAAVLFFVFLNGFFVAAEFALVKVRGTRLSELAATGSRRAQVASHLHDNLDRYLSGCQLGITLASLILGWLAEPAVAQLLLLGAGAAGFEFAAEDPLLHGVALALALGIVTALHMTIGEQAPKLWAIHRAEPITLQIAIPLRLFVALFRPFIWAINEVSNGMLRLVGISEREIMETSHSVEELRRILATSAEAGHITKGQRDFAENILGIMGLEVRHILLPRVDVDYLSLQNSQEENLRVLRETGHSRFPLCKVGLDSVVGIVHSKDVMGALMDQQPVDFGQLAREAVFVSDTQPVSRLILTLQRGRSHIAVVLDEHGTAIGLAFLEDALEEIVGPIQDEFDIEDDYVRRVAPGVLEVAGDMALPEAVDLLGLGELVEEADTIGGYITATLGRLPRKGDTAILGEYRATVLEMDRRRIARLRLERLPPGDEGKASAADSTPDADPAGSSSGSS
jgi:CBS domain containing-hemolysin-like protein